MLEENSKIKLFVQGSFFLMISNICIKAINFFLLPLYTKNLTPSMLGVSDSITTFTGILLPVLVLGLDSAYSAFYFDKYDSHRDKKVFSTLGITFFIMGLIPILMCTISTSISKLLFRTDMYQTEIIVSLIGVTLHLWYLPFSLELRLKNRMGKFGMISIISSFSMVILNILFVTVFKLGELSLILSTTIVAGELLLLYGGSTNAIPHKKFYDSYLLNRMIKFALPLIPSVLMGWVLALSDRYILLYYFGNESVGLYGIGARVVTLLNVVINAITTAYTTFAFSIKDDENAQQKYYTIFNVVSVALMVITYTVSVFSKEIIILMTDAAYKSSYVIIRDMMFGQVFYAMSTIISYGIVFEKKSVYSLFAVSAGAVVNLVLNLIYIPRYGVSAAALTTLLGYFVNLLVCYVFSEKLYPCKYGIKRVMITCAIIYAVSLIFVEAMWQIKILVWILVCIGLIIAYIDIIGTILEFFKHIFNTHGIIKK